MCDLLAQLMLSPSGVANQAVAAVAAAMLTFAESLSYKLYAKSCKELVRVT